MNNCLFCRIANKELSAVIINETENLIVIQSLENHPLVIPKKHFQDIYTLDDETGSEIMKEAMRISRAIKQALHCEGINLIQSNELAAGQEIFHFHLHIKPRWKNDEVKLSWDLTSADDELRRQTAKKIQEALV